jgi:hypothetical protein
MRFRWVLTVRLADEELLGDLGVGRSSREEQQHLAFSGGERLQGRRGVRYRLRALHVHLDESAGDARREQHVSARDGVDRLQQPLGAGVLEEKAGRLTDDLLPGAARSKATTPARIGPGRRPRVP